jgi:hypothetical protein
MQDPTYPHPLFHPNAADGDEILHGSASLSLGATVPP